MPKINFESATVRLLSGKNATPPRSCATPPRRCELSLHKARLRKKERSEGAQTPSHLVPHICGHRDKTLKPSLTWKPTRLRSSATPDAGGGSARSMASGSTDTAPSQSSQKSCCGRLIPSRSTF